MKALEWIVKEAKKLKKEYPKRFTTWKEYVSQASAIYAKKHKGKSSVGKKKTATKKKVGAVKKKEAPKKKSNKVSSHKDTKSHNVKINVTSGIGTVKSTGIGILKDKYGKLHIKKLSEKTKRGKKAITKELNDVIKKIKKLQSL